MNIPSLEDLIGAAAGGGWEWLDKADARLMAAVDPTLRKKHSAERRTLAEATARLFASDDGQVVLEAMLDRTLRRIVFMVQLGLDPMQAYQFGVFREGQNAIVQELLRLIGEGRPGAPVIKEAGEKTDVRRSRSRRRRTAGNDADRKA